MRQYGAPEEQIAQVVSERCAKKVFAVLPLNAPVLAAFLAASTQWRLSPNGTPIGLDYASALASIRALRLPLTPDDWRGVQLMEARVIRCLSG